MEDTRRVKCSCNPVSVPPSKLAMHKDSHVITKFKPKVRIIHLFAPEIIKTDVANFRELVQRLTGKPGENLDLDETSDKGCGNRKNKRTRNSPCCKKSMMMNRKSTTTFSSCGSNLQNMQEEKLKMEEEENEIWGSSGENSSKFLDGFADFNGFMCTNLCGNVSLTTPHSSHMDVFGDFHFA